MQYFLQQTPRKEWDPALCINGQRQQQNVKRESYTDFSQHVKLAFNGSLCDKKLKKKKKRLGLLDIRTIN